MDTITKTKRPRFACKSIRVSSTNLIEIKPDKKRIKKRRNLVRLQRDQQEITKAIAVMLTFHYLLSFAHSISQRYL